MAMPKTSVNENNTTQPWKNKIRSSGKISPMKPVAVTERMHNLAHKHFRLGIFPSNKGHQTTSIFSCKRVQGAALRNS